MANYQTGGYKIRPMSGWNRRIGSQPFVYELMCISRPSLPVTKSNPLKRETKGHGRSTVSNGQTRGREKTHARFFFDSFFCGAFCGQTIHLTEKCLNRQIGTCLLGTRWYNFQSCTPTLRAAMHHRQTDRRTTRSCQ